METGGGPCKQIPLNDVEERVADLANLHATVAGNLARSFGINPVSTITDHNNNTNQQAEHPELSEEQQSRVPPEPLVPPASPAPPRRTKRKNTEAVLRQNQEMIDVMKNHCEIQ
uniref:Uncharacterized protein n=1 Tax=Anopheles atroparvus TaxID=41427 RepID=A0AAG5DFU3_ANOAO